MGKILNDLPAIRKKFHQYPETLWTEFWTTATICEYLEDLGFELTIGKDIIQPDLREMVPENEIIENSYKEAIEYALKKEEESIKFYQNMKELAKPEDFSTIDMIISEENLHITDLLELKSTT